MHQIMRDVLRGALMENLIIDKWVTCRKCEKLPFEKVRKGTKRHERAQLERHSLSKYAPNHAWRTIRGINGKHLFSRLTFFLSSRSIFLSSSNRSRARNFVVIIKKKAPDLAKIVGVRSQ